MQQQIPITQEGKMRLQAKLEIVRKEFGLLPKIIGEARAKGDLKENAEYHAAKERQGMLNAEIQKLNYELTHSKVIAIDSLPCGIVTFGKRVLLMDLDVEREVEYILLGTSESDPKVNKISISSLVAKALLGKKVDDEVVVEVPSGRKRYKIMGIEPYQ